MRIAWLFVFLLVTSWQLNLGMERFRWESKRAEAQAGVTRLAKVALGLYPAGSTPVIDNFWKEIGRADSILDPWGKAYALELVQPGLLRWRSAGPDRGYGTKDDILAAVPYGSSRESDSDGSAPTVETLPVIDAR